MRIEDFISKELVNMGMLPNQAKEVLHMVKENIPALDDRWADNLTDYPDSIRSIVIFMLKREGLKWIDKNLPEAWYRELFLPKKETK